MHRICFYSREFIAEALFIDGEYISKEQEALWHKPEA